MWRFSPSALNFDRQPHDSDGCHGDNAQGRAPLRLRPQLAQRGEQGALLLNEAARVRASSVSVELITRSIAIASRG